MQVVSSLFVSAFIYHTLRSLHKKLHVINILRICHHSIPPYATVPHSHSPLCEYLPRPIISANAPLHKGLHFVPRRQLHFLSATRYLMQYKPKLEELTTHITNFVPDDPDGSTPRPLSPNILPKPLPQTLLPYNDYIPLSSNQSIHLPPLSRLCNTLPSLIFISINFCLQMSKLNESGVFRIQSLFGLLYITPLNKLYTYTLHSSL